MSRDEVNGVAVVARQAATIVTPVTNGEALPITTVDELLLADESTVYQCVHPYAPDCVATFDNVISTRAHQTSHSKKREAAKLQHELDVRKQRQITGGLKAAETRKRNTELRRQEREIGLADDGLGEIHAGLNQLERDIDVTRDALGVLADNLNALIAKLGEVKLADPEIAAKAARFDQLQSLMNTK